MTFCILVVLAALALLPRAAGADGAWTSYLRSHDFTDLIATPDEVWAATSEAGLLRFDRTTGTFTIIRREPGSIGSNTLTSLALDRRGRLWVGTAGAGVSRLSEDRSRWDTVNRFDGLPVDDVTVLERAAGDSLWIGTTQGIAVWNGTVIGGSLPDGNNVSFDTTFTEPDVVGIAVLRDTVWIATRTTVGFARLSTGLTDWRPVRDGLPATELQGLASDGRTVLSLTNGGTSLYDQTQGRWSFFGTGAVAHNLVDDAGEVLAADRIGISRWNGSGWTRFPGSPAARPSDADDPEPTIDASGHVFVGAPDEIHEQTDSTTWVRHAAPGGPPINSLLNVAVEGPRVYVCTDAGGFARLEGTTWRHWPRTRCSGAGCDTTFTLPSFTFALMVDRVGHKWVGCWDEGIDHFDDSVSPPVFRHNFPSPPDVDTRKHTWGVSAAADFMGNRWIGLDTRDRNIRPIGLDRYGPDGNFVGNYNPGNSGMAGYFVRAMTVSANGRVWLGYTNQGVDYFQQPSATGPIQVNHLTETGQLDVRGLAAFGDSLWVLSPSELRRYSARDLGSARQFFRVDDGQEDLSLRPLAAGPDGAVWVGTNAGLRVYRPGVSGFEVFNVSNSPLTSDAVLSVDVAPDGIVWIATGSGLNRFDPGFEEQEAQIEHLTIRVYPNPVTLTGLGLGLRLTGDATAYRGEIYDLHGRLIRRFGVPANGRVIWDGRDQEGTPVKPGMYFVRAEAGGREAVARIAILR